MQATYGILCCPSALSRFRSAHLPLSGHEINSAVEWRFYRVKEKTNRCRSVTRERRAGTIDCEIKPITDSTFIGRLLQRPSPWLLKIGISVSRPAPFLSSPISLLTPNDGHHVWQKVMTGQSIGLGKMGKSWSTNFASIWSIASI